MRNPIRALVWLVGGMLFLTSWGAAVADGTRGRWWHVTDIAQQLQLADDEIQRLDTAYEAARIRMIEIKSAVEIERLKLRSLMEQRDFSETAAMAQHGKQEEARRQLSDERFRFLLEVRKIVGHDRFIKLLEIQDAYRQRRHSKDRDKAIEKP